MNTKWNQSGISISGENELNQLFWPQNIYIDDNQTIYVADHGNNRIMKWTPNAYNGQIVAGENGYGCGMNQLNQPTDVIVDKNDHSLIICDWGNRRIIRRFCENDNNEQIIISNIDCWGLTIDDSGNIYTSDYKKNEVRQWKKGDLYGRIVAGGNANGNRSNQLNWPTFLFVDQDYSLYVSDNNNHRVMKWTKDAKEGIVVAGGHDRGNRLTQLSNPHGIYVDHLKNVFVADFGNHRVVCWPAGAKEGIVIVGGNGEGKESNQLSGPAGVSFDREGHCYVVDHRNNRIQKFLIDSN